jgi:exodeoxyribonuclease VII large subunit
VEKFNRCQDILRIFLQANHRSVQSHRENGKSRQKRRSRVKVSPMFNNALPTHAVPPEVNEPVLTVSDLNAAVRKQLETRFPPLWVEGEIAQLTVASSGHMYFTLKDAGAQVRCALFRTRAARLTWQPRQGDKVRARAQVTLYEARGEFQLTIDSLVKGGLGTLYERFLQLKNELEAAGLFDPARKRALPGFPATIGIITSPQAAALHDVLTTLERRAPYARLILYPTLVQGADATAQIVQAIEAANRHAQADVLLLCRGGGSLEDLWCFNEAAVVRAVANSELPIICGVGHETDTTLADLAADVRAPTPTAAAEIVAPDKTRMLSLLEMQRGRLQQRIARQLDESAMRLDGYSARLRSPMALLERQQDRLLQYRTRLSHWAERSLARDQRRLGELSLRLQALDPEQPLQRGYALITDEQGHLIDSITKAPPQTAVELRLADGRLQARIESVRATRAPH